MASHSVAHVEARKQQPSESSVAVSNPPPAALHPNYQLFGLYRKYFPTPDSPHPQYITDGYWPRSLRDAIRKIVDDALVKASKAKAHHLTSKLEDLEALSAELARSCAATHVTKAFRVAAMQVVRDTLYRTQGLRSTAGIENVGSWPLLVESVDIEKAPWWMPQLSDAVLTSLLSALAKEDYVGEFELVRTAASRSIEVQCLRGRVSEAIELLRALPRCANTEVAPEDIVQFIEVDTLPAAYEESTSGDVFKAATLGAVCTVMDTAEDKYDVGITVWHAAQKQDLANDDWYTRSEFRGLEIALIKVPTTEDCVRCCKHANSVPLRMGRDDSDLPVKEEHVYKIGSATGLTIGTYDGVKNNVRVVESRNPNTPKYSNVHCVKWQRGCPFAAGGDCGSLYCVRRGAHFIPFAIHWLGGDDRSYGSSLLESLESVGVMVTSFSNPPLAEPQHCDM